MNTVLVVDDAPANVDVVLSHLTATGFRVLYAGSGARAQAIGAARSGYHSSRHQNARYGWHRDLPADQAAAGMEEYTHYLHHRCRRAFPEAGSLRSGRGRLRDQADSPGRSRSAGSNPFKDPGIAGRAGTKKSNSL